jgi:WD40-like Beta Propeller Repeat
VYVISVDGGPPKRVTTDAAFDGLAAWSSDGRWIYFSSLKSARPEVWKVPADGGAPTRITHDGGGDALESADGQTLFYLDRPPPGAGGTSGTSRLMSVPVGGGAEAVVLDRVRLGLWSPTNDGIVFLTIGPDADAIDFYGFRERTTRRLGTLLFRASRVAGFGRLTTSRDGRWALVNATDMWESDIMVAEGVR